jgi:hypothetical protein
VAYLGQVTYDHYSKFSSLPVNEFGGELSQLGCSRPESYVFISSMSVLRNVLAQICTSLGCSFPCLTLLN